MRKKRRPSGYSLNCGGRAFALLHGREHKGGVNVLQ